MLYIYLLLITYISSAKCSTAFHFENINVNELNNDHQKLKPLIEDLLVISSEENAHACETHTLQLNCKKGEVINITAANYGRKSRQICEDDRMLNTNCSAENTFAIMRNRCNNKNSCSVQAVNSIFGDPCVGTYKYAEVHYQCIQSYCTETQFHCNDGECIDISKYCDGFMDCKSGEEERYCNYLTKIACEHSILEIGCAIGHSIRVIGANYGRQLPHICRHQSNTNCVSHGSKRKMQERCNGKRSCKISATNNQFGDPCNGVIKYLIVNYRCIDNSVS